MVSSVEAAEQTASNADTALFVEALDLIKAGQQKQAITEKLDPLIEKCESAYNPKGKRVFGSKNKGQTKIYLLGAINGFSVSEGRGLPQFRKWEARSKSTAMTSAKDGIAGESKYALTVSYDCTLVIFLKGSALNTLTEYENATQALMQALDFSPLSAEIANELVYTLQSQKNWKTALYWSEYAEFVAELFPDLEAPGRDMARAKRNTGYSLIELGRLDEAEKKFKEVLMSNPDDAKANDELTYIDSLRTKSKQ